MAIKGIRKRTMSKKPSKQYIAEETAKLAYEMFASRGYQDGNDTEDWVNAEKIIAQKYK